MYTNITLEKQNHLAIIKLNRPDSYNAVDSVMAAELLDALTVSSTDPQVRAVLITGDGKAFSSGQDLADVGDIDNVPFQEIIERQYNPIVKKITQMKMPIIAYVNGVAAGAGANLALCCDIVVASDAASFIQAFAKIGLVPDTGGTWTLPRAVGLQNAMGMMLTGDKVSADEARMMGMVYRVWPAEEADDQAVDFATNISEMPTKALYETKKLLQESYQNSLSEQLKAEMVTQQMLGASHDFKEGVTAFLEKRKPDFRGE